MATFKAQVVKIFIESHPNADSLELARVGEYRSIVRKGQFKDGDLGVFIPPAAILPNWLIVKLGLEGRLAGKAKNRVKEVKLRGVLSEGVVLPLNGADGDYELERPVNELGTEVSEVIFVQEGDDVTEYLGIVKYEPEIPAHMSGEVCNMSGYTLHYDIENYKKYPDIITDETRVTITEKLHGTNVQIGYLPSVDNEELIERNVIVASKGLGAAGLVFKDVPANENNLYVRTYKDTVDSEGRTIGARIRELANSGKYPFIQPDTAVFIVGEIFGPKVQTGFAYGFDKPTLRVFDIYIGLPRRGRYLHEFEKMTIIKDLNLERVPILYFGPWSKELIKRYTSGKETLSGKQTHMREGVIITPQLEYHHDAIGRVILKSVSDEYLSRNDKDATEYS